MKNTLQRNPKIEQLLDNYLDVSIKRRSPAGLLTILTALWEYTGEENWRQSLIKKIIEFIIRTYDIHVFKLDRRNFHIIIKCLLYRIRQSSEKAKVALIRAKTVDIIAFNIDVLRPS